MSEWKYVWMWGCKNVRIEERKDVGEQVGDDVMM